MEKKKPKESKQKKITLTLRITDAQEIKMMNELKTSTGEKTYSRALMYAAKECSPQSWEIEKLTVIIGKQTEQINKAHEVLHFLSSSQRMLEGYTKNYIGNKKFPKPESFS